MKTVKIKDERSGLEAVILPDYGGAISTLKLKNVDVLYFNPKMLGISNILSGGIPVLFPFCSKTNEDTYVLNHKKYTMPFHGLVKGMTFSVEKISSDSVSIYTVSNEVIKKENYPFDFKLGLEYSVKGHKLSIQAVIENNSQTDMPFYIGWHPFFKASSKKDLVLDFDAENFFDYINEEKGKHIGDIKLENSYDHVFWGLKTKEIVLKNPVDNYSASIILDDMHDVVTIWTGGKDYVCIEPWTGMPDSINTGKMLKWINKKNKIRCGIKLALEII